MTKADIKKSADSFIEDYKKRHPGTNAIQLSYLWEGYVNGMMDMVQQANINLEFDK